MIPSTTRMVCQINLCSTYPSAFGRKFFFHPIHIVQPITSTISAPRGGLWGHRSLPTSDKMGTFELNDLHNEQDARAWTSCFMILLTKAIVFRAFAGGAPFPGQYSQISALLRSFALILCARPCVWVYLRVGMKNDRCQKNILFQNTVCG